MKLIVERRVHAHVNGVEAARHSDELYVVEKEREWMLFCGEEEVARRMS